MGAYGDTNIWSPVRRVAVDASQEMYVARFTTAGAGAPTIDSAKTRGAISIARTGTGVHTITLPKAMKNVSVQTSQCGGTTAQVPWADMVEGTKVCTVTTVTAGGSTPADSTGIIIEVVITGTVR